MVVLSGFRVTLVRSVFTCSARRIRTRREKAWTPRVRDHRSDVSSQRSPYRVRRDALEPVVIEIEEDHLRFSGLQNEVSQFLHLETCLERQL